MVNFIPMDDKVLIKPDIEYTSGGGIIIPNAENKAHDTGTVMAVGLGKFSTKGVRIPLDVKVGDKVIFSKYVPNDVKVNGEDMLVVLSEQILGIIEE